MFGYRPSETDAMKMHVSVQIDAQGMLKSCLAISTNQYHGIFRAMI